MGDERGRHEHSPRRGGVEGGREGYRERPEERELVYGVEPVRELIAAAPGVIRILYVKDREQRRFGEEIRRVRASGGQVRTADDAELTRVAGSSARHQGIVAQTRPYNYTALEELLAEKHDPLLVVDGVTDPRNLGAILRSAEGSGARAVIIARDRTAPVTPAAIKASAGAWIHLRIARCGNVANLLRGLKEDGYWIAALAPGGKTSLYELDVSRRLAIVVGSEERGVRELVRKTADFVVSIPMRGRVGSLNVSVATAVALFEVARRRETPS